MTQLQKCTWLIDTIRRAGKISLDELSERWSRNRDLNDEKPLSRSTFNRWRDAIYSQFGIMIDCQRVGGYLYYISNPEDIDEDCLRKWMLDSFAVGNLIGENLSLKNRILVDEIPSSREYLPTILEAMNDNRQIEISYHQFAKDTSNTYPVEPYCVKLFENRWYMLGRNDRGELRVYGLDRIESMRLLDATFSVPKDFDASAFFANYFGVVIGSNIAPVRVVIRAYGSHKYYLQSLPLHHSQRLLVDYGNAADFELFLTPTYDFIMKLMQSGAMIEVVSPASLRKTMKEWISDMSKLYKND